MATNYTDAQKREILTYARDNGGPVAAAQKYGVARQLITYWNKKFKIYTPKPTNYPHEFKVQVLQYAELHGVRPAAKHFGVSMGIIKVWNAGMKLYQAKRHTYTMEQKREILIYARDFGVRAAAGKFDVNESTIVSWNNQLKVYTPLKTYDEETIIKILEYARDHGVAAASACYDVAKFTLTRWNKIYNIYQPRKQPTYIPYTPQQQQEILHYALGVYEEMPADSRSAWAVLCMVAPIFNATCNQLYIWNRKFKIIPVRTVRRAEPSAEEIAAVQKALNVSRNRIAGAARRSGTSARGVRRMIDKSQVKLRAPEKDAASRVPVGLHKKRIISGIISGLLQTKAK